MRSIGWLGSVAVVLSMLANAGVAAQELAVRKGVVTAMTPLQQQASNSGAGTVTKRRLGGMLSRAAGRALGNTGYGSEAAYVVDGVVTDASNAEAQRVAAQAGSYMVIVRFSDGAESAFTRNGSDLRGVTVGSKVKVVGSGDSTILMADPEG